MASLALFARVVLLHRSQGALTFFDERDYHALGQSLANGAGFLGVHGPTAFRPPGQPVFLGLVYALLGPSVRGAQLVQCLLLATLPFAAARIARLVSRQPGVSIGAAAFAAFHPGLSYAALSLYPAVLTAVALTWGIALAAEGLTTSRPHVWIAEHPMRWTALSLGRAVAVLDSVGRPKTQGRHDAVLAKLAGYALFPVVLLGLLGTVWFRRSVVAQLSGAALACVVLAAAPTLVKPRFRFPCDPALGALAAASLGALSARVRARDAKARERSQQRCPA